MANLFASIISLNSTSALLSLLYSSFSSITVFITSKHYLRSLKATWKDYQAFRHAFLRMTRQILTGEKRSSLLHFISIIYLFLLGRHRKKYF